MSSSAGVGYNTQIVSIAADGTALFWDLRMSATDKIDLALLDLAWKPFFKVVLTRTERSGDYDGCRIAVAPAPGTSLASKKSGKDEPINTKVFVGTEVSPSKCVIV